MDAPPPAENVRPFLTVAERLHSLGYSAPEIFAADEEFGLIEEVVRLGDLAFETFCEAVAPGRKEYEVLADVEHVLRFEGAEEVFFIVGSGERPVNRFWDMADRTLEKGDAVIFCIEHCGSGGYWSQFIRTVTLGPAREEVLRMTRSCTVRFSEPRRR